MEKYVVTKEKLKQNTNYNYSHLDNVSSDYKWLFCYVGDTFESLVGNIVGMTHAIFKIKTNFKKI
jgi:hypothetical protein